MQADGTRALVQVSPVHAVWMRSDEVAIDEHAARIDGGESPLAFEPPSENEDAAGRLGALGRMLVRRRGVVLLSWVAIVAVSLPLAGGLAHALKAGGFLVSGGETTQVIDRVGSEFDQPRSQIAVILPGPVERTKQTIATLKPKLESIDNVKLVGEPLVSKNGELVAMPVAFEHIEQESIETLWAVRDLMIDEGGFSPADVRIAGTTASAADTTEQAKRDLAKAELFGIPAALIVLLFVFRTVVAALVPIIVGCVSVLVSFAALRLVAADVDLSIFVMNIASLLGLGLGVDYSLLGVSRFRAELAKGASTEDAATAMVVNSGRAAMVSALAVAAGMAALAAIPLGVMTSIAIGGVVVVAVTMLASITLLPALLASLGANIERLPVPGRNGSSDGDPTRSRWYGVVTAVMRRPLLSLVLSCGVLLALMLPVLRAHIDIPHDEVLLKSPSRDAARVYEQQFDRRVVAPIVVIADTDDPTVVGDLVERFAVVEHVDEVVVVATSKRRHETLLNLVGDEQTGRGGALARAMVDDIRGMDLPARVVVGGVASGEGEFLDALRAKVPVTLAIVFVLTLVILGIAFRSIVLPLKAILLATISIAAAFGVLTWVFQDGGAAGLLGIDGFGYVDATLPILMFCILFSLSMDYEVFLLARITELYQSGLDDDEATARGVADTAPLITGAALILVVLGISFALADLVLVQEIGFGMAVALAIDASIVRFVLLPAAMRLLGPRNWWMPRWLALRTPRLAWSH